MSDRLDASLHVFDRHPCLAVFMQAARVRSSPASGRRVCEKPGASRFLTSILDHESLSMKWTLTYVTSDHLLCVLVWCHLHLVTYDFPQTEQSTTTTCAPPMMSGPCLMMRVTTTNSVVRALAVHAAERQQGVHTFVFHSTSHDRLELDWPATVFSLLPVTLISHVISVSLHRGCCASRSYRRSNPDGGRLAPAPRK